MSYCISPSIHTPLPCADLLGFKSSCITLIEGSSSLVPDVLFRLCVSSVVSSDRHAMFVDGWNSFNPYAFSKIAKSFGAEPRKVLSRIHVARVIRIEQPSKKLIRIFDDGIITEYVPVPSGQMRFTDFTDFDIKGGNVYGQNSAFISCPA